MQWMLTDSGSVPLPALTKHPSEGGRKALQPPRLPSLRGNVGAESGPGILEGWESGGFFKRDARDKGVPLVCAGEQHAEYVALKAKLLYWLHKDSHS